MCVLGYNVDHVFFCALVPFAGGHVEGAALVVGGEIPRIGLAYALMTGGFFFFFTHASCRKARPSVYCEELSARFRGK